MKENLIKRLKRSWLTIWIVLAVAALSTIGGLAAYTSVQSVKRVVSTQKGTGMLFSSNYLQEGDSPVLKNVTVSNTDTDPKVTVTVCNFPQTRVKHNESDITYTFEVTLVDKDGNEIADTIENIDNYTVKFGNEAAQSFSADKKTITFENQTLSALDFSQDEFTLTFDKSNLTDPKVFMKVTATPSDETDLKPISAIMGVVYIKPYSAAWSGVFTDDAVSPTALDGFNYRLSGSGQGTITLTWNTKYVDISPWFLDKYQDKISDKADGKLTLTVDSSVKNQYNIQFYRTAAINDSEKFDANKSTITVGSDSFVTMKFVSSSSDQG